MPNTLILETPIWLTTQSRTNQLIDQFQIRHDY